MKNSNTIDVLYDGNCLFWGRIMKLVKRLNRSQCIHLTNITARKFEAKIYDQSQCELMSDLHARLSDGTWLKGSDVFRELFSKTGLRPLVMLSRLPLLRQLFNACYWILFNALLKLYRPTARQTGSHAAVSAKLSTGPITQR